MPKSRTSSRRKTPKKAPLSLSVKLPHKRVRDRFLIIYELEGCQKAADFLTGYYSVTQIRIILNGKMVCKKKSNLWIACYSKNKAYFTKEGLNKKIVLHELCQHFSNNLELKLHQEAKEANNYARVFLKKDN